MAIDSAEKRQSISGIQVTLISGVTSNTAQDVEWRQEVGWGYPGIAPSGGFDTDIMSVPFGALMAVGSYARYGGFYVQHPRMHQGFSMERN